MSVTTFRHTERRAYKNATVVLATGALTTGQMRRYGLIVANNAAALTITVPAANRGTAGLRRCFLNKGVGLLTVQFTDAAGVATRTVARGHTLWLTCDGINWYAAANEPDGDKWTINLIGGVLALEEDNDGAFTNGGGVHGGSGVTLTEADGVFCVVNTAALWGLLEASGGVAGYTNNLQMFPDAPADDDAFYFGGPIPFCEVAIDMSVVVQVYGAPGVLAWEYWNGAAWVAIPNFGFDHTGATGQAGDYWAEQDGAFSFAPPLLWASTDVNGQAGYWIRAVIQAGGGVQMTTSGVADFNPSYVSPNGDAPTANRGCTITSIRLSDFAAVVHSTRDIQFCLVDFTKGTYSDELVFAQDIDTHVFDLAAHPVVCDADDLLGICITQDDGAAEMGPIGLELDTE